MKIFSYILIVLVIVVLIYSDKVTEIKHEYLGSKVTVTFAAGKESSLNGPDVDTYTTTSPVGTRIQVNINSNDVSGVTEMWQEGEKTYIVVEPLNNGSKPS